MKQLSPSYHQSNSSSIITSIQQCKSECKIPGLNTNVSLLRQPRKIDKFLNSHSYDLQQIFWIFRMTIIPTVKLTHFTQMTGSYAKPGVSDGLTHIQGKFFAIHTNKDTYHAKRQV